MDHAKARRNLAAAGRAGQLGRIITTLSKLIVLMLPPLSSLRPAWLYRIRGGIEGTNSGLKRKTGLGQLRVRGRPRVFYSILLKIVGWNILRATACAKMREIVYARANASVFWLNFVFLRMSMSAERVCVSRSKQILNIASLASDCDIAPITAKKWLSILECSFIIKLLRPHYRNFNKRLIKSPKLYFTDTGLLCFLLKIRSAQDLRTHDSRGAIFETWVVSEFLKNYYNHHREPDIYFWRDSNANEVDLLISRGSELLPIGILARDIVEMSRTRPHYKRTGR